MKLLMSKKDAGNKACIRSTPAGNSIPDFCSTDECMWWRENKKGKGLCAAMAHSLIKIFPKQMRAIKD